MWPQPTAFVSCIDSHSQNPLSSAAMAASHKLKVDKDKSSSDDKASKAKSHNKPN